MKYTKPQQSSANPSRPGPTVDDSDAARQRLQTSFGKAIGLLEELGAFDDIAVIVSSGPTVCRVGVQRGPLWHGPQHVGQGF